MGVFFVSIIIRLKNLNLTQAIRTKINLGKD